MRNKNVERLVKLGLWAALSVVLVILVHFPIFPAIPFIEYDPADIPILMASFAFGPWWGLLLTVVVSVIQGLTVSASSGIIGILMHILSTGAGAVAAGLVYKKKKTRHGAVGALILYILTILIIMPILNYFVSPIFLSSGYGMSYGQAQSQILGLMWWILAFNLIKPIINAVVTFLLYKPISRYILKEPIVESAATGHRSYLWVDFATLGIYLGVLGSIHILRVLFFPPVDSTVFTLDNGIMVIVYLILAVLSLYLNGKWRAALKRRDNKLEDAQAKTVDT